jgi:eukaryotic-like serine/threonine-protein kinase
MNTRSSCNEDLIRQLPLPLAQLYRRAHNAKTPHERHHASYYLWEAGLKLLGSVAVVVYAEAREHDPELAERLQNLARPSVGHWWEFVRRLAPVLADQGDQGFAPVRELLLGRSRDNLPHAAGLDAVLLQVFENREAAGTHATVRLTELFDRLVRYRNREFGHGAVGQRTAGFYDRVGRALLAGVPEVFSHLDPLAGRRLLLIADVRRQTTGRWLVERYELRGEAPRRLESLDLPDGEAVRGLLPDRLYLESLAPVGGGSADSEGPRVVSLHPLLVSEADGSEVLFLNARRGRQGVDYLSYSTGRELARADLTHEHRDLLAGVLRVPVDAPSVAGWAARSRAEEQVEGLTEEAPAVGRRLGEFELLSELGRGGMGVVYRAWQPSLGRQVALKALFRTGDPKAEARFAREIRALGKVEHPRLAKIFVSGNDGEQWFYAMELVEGASLAAVCENLQHRSSRPETVDVKTWQDAVSTVCSRARQAEKPLSDASPGGESAAPAPTSALGRETSPQVLRRGQSYVRQVVDLVRQVADAAHALHERGILHRDIKPGNILVTTDGSQAVLMDLGLAQLADEVGGRLTRTRQFVGTLRYASPEQVLAVGGLDRRSDVYNLGATLWELLTLRPLFNATEQTPTPELMRRIQVEEPERLRKYHAGLSRDLEAIALKCLEKDAHRRYATARDLARDLERYQAGEPVQARPVGQVQRSWRWCRRNPAWASMFVVLALVVFGSMGGLYAMYRHADQERQNADAQRNVAEKNGDGQRKIKEFYRENILSAPRPIGFEGGASTQVKLWEALDRAVPKIGAAFAGQPELEAAVRHDIGLTYSYLGRYEAARVQGEKAYQIRLALLGPDHPDTLNSEFELADYYNQLGKNDEAVKLFRDLLEREPRVLPPDNENLLYTPLRLGSALLEKEQIAEAEAMLRAGIEACKNKLGPTHHHTFCGQVRLANVLAAKDCKEEALALQRETYEGRKKALGEEAYDTLLSMGEFGALLRRQGQFPEAEKVLLLNLKLRQKVLGPEHSYTLYAMHHVAFLREAQEKLPEAEKIHREALAIWQRVYGPEDADTLTCQANLASNLETQEKLPEAKALYEQILQTRRRVLGPDHSDTLDSLWSLANFQNNRKQYAEAEQLYRELIAGNTRVYGPDHKFTVGRQIDLAYVLVNLNRVDEAGKVFRDTLAIRRRVLGLDNSETLKSEHNLAWVFEKQGKLPEAEQQYRQTLEARRRILGPDHADTLETLDSLANLLETRGKLDEAEKLFRELLVVRRKGSDLVEVAYVLVVLGRVLIKSDRAAEAEPLLRESLKLRTEKLPPGDWRIGAAQSWLGRSLARQKKFAEAETLLLAGSECVTRAKDTPPERLKEALEGVIELYEKWPRPELVEAWRKKLPATPR